MLVEELVWIESDQILIDPGANRRCLGKEHVLGNNKYDLICCGDLQEATGGDSEIDVNLEAEGEGHNCRGFDKKDTKIGILRIVM